MAGCGGRGGCGCRKIGSPDPCCFPGGIYAVGLTKENQALSFSLRTYNENQKVNFMLNSTNFHHVLLHENQSTELLYCDIYICHIKCHFTSEQLLKNKLHLKYCN